MNANKSPELNDVHSQVSKETVELLAALYNSLKLPLVPEVCRVASMVPFFKMVAKRVSKELWSSKFDICTWQINRQYNKELNQ